MNGLDLLEKYPLAANVVKDWFMRSMLESFKDENVPEEFKQFMLEQGIEDDKVGKLIDVNVRILFDVFDENDIIIIIKYHDNFGFTWAVEEADEQSFYKTRKEAEHFAVEVAFDILETKLTPAVKEIEVTDEEIVKE
jgi:mRNA-degrading endonuclease RelE of RelBE toxin-antitoxin system